MDGFFRLGFLPEAGTSEDQPLLLGARGHSKRILLEIAGWLLVAAGIFLRQGLEIVNLSWKWEQISIGAFSASCVIALAVLPSFMRWFNRRRSKVGIEHLALPFAF